VYGGFGERERNVWERADAHGIYICFFFEIFVFWASAGVVDLNVVWDLIPMCASLFLPRGVVIFVSPYFFHLQKKDSFFFFIPLGYKKKTASRRPDNLLRGWRKNPSSSPPPQIICREEGKRNDGTKKYYIYHTHILIAFFIIRESIQKKTSVISLVYVYINRPVPPMVILMI